MQEIVPQKIYSPGDCLTNGGYPVEALPFLEAELKQHPNNFGTLANIGICHKWLGNYDKAIEANKACLKLAPGLVEAHHNLGLCYEETGRFEEAIKEYAFACSWTAHPNNQFALASALLRERRFEEAGKIWETSRLGKKAAILLPNIDVWRGEDLEDQKILVTREGGYGDVFWLMRYLKPLKDRGAHVTLQVPKPQVELLRGHPWADEVVVDSDPVTLQDFDYQVPLWSIMWELRKLGLEVPWSPEGPYIEVRETLKGHVGLDVGIAWEAGEVTSIHRKMRAIQDEYLPALAEVPVNWYSLLPDKKPDWCKGVCPLGWKKTAEYIAKLDLVISSDTGLAHLSAAMGKPTWIFLPKNSAWFYFAEEGDCSWYPSVRLFRNTDPVSFKPVVDHLVEELGKWVADKELWREEVIA